MRARTGWRPVLTLTLVGIALGISVLPVNAGVPLGGYLTRSKDRFLANLESGKVKVRCPEAYRVLAAGATWRSGGAESTPVGRSISVSGPREGGRAWLVAGTNDNVDGVLRVMVRCLRSTVIGQTTTVIVDTAVGGGETFAACPEGTTIVSGGALMMTAGAPHVPSTGGGLLTYSAPVDRRTWIAAGDGTGLFLRITLRCRTNGEVGPTEMRFGEVSVPRFGTGRATAACPSGRRALVGGTFWKTTSGAIAASSPFGISRPSGDSRSWIGEGWATSHNLKLVAAILCRAA